MSFLDISQVKVRQLAIDQTMSHLRASGSSGCEGIALWVGTRSENTFTVFTAYVPKQYGVRMNTGLIAYVDDAELHSLNLWLYERKLELIAQVHSHPTDAYHSDTDDAYPIATRRGAFSVVVPNFAIEPFEFQNCAIYRLSDEGWRILPEDSLSRIFSVEG